MSGQDSSEEKNLPPTEQTLRKAREKGQIPASKDFVTAIVTIGAIAYVALAWSTITRRYANTFDLSLQSITGDFSDSYERLSTVIILDMAMVIAPLMAVVFVLAVFSNIIHKNGIPFSLDPIKPKFDKLNPMAGFKKNFNFRSMVEFAVSFVRLSIWFSVTSIIFWVFLSQILNSSICGLPCVLTTGFLVLITTIAAAVLLMLLAALLDLPMQVALFKQEKKMTHSQLKQENKESFGSPEIKSRRNELHRELLESAGNMKQSKGRVTEPTFVVYGGGKAIAIYFDTKAQQVPFVVAKGQGDHAVSIMESAETLNIPLEQNLPLADKIFRTTNIGSPVNEDTFEDLVIIIIKAGLI